MNTFEAVGEFHKKFNLATADDTAPHFPEEATIRFRLGFMIEELAEYADACGLHSEANLLLSALKYVKESTAGIDVFGQDLDKAADALGDLKYVTDGTAHMMGIPLNKIFTEIQRANMGKERATGADDSRSVRKSALDVVKPAGWTPPDHGAALAEAKARFTNV